MMDNLDKAISVAIAAHSGQLDKSRKPYILHPLRLMQQCHTTEEMITAVLHDVVEDSEVTIEDLKSMGFSLIIIDAIEHLSKRTDENYDQFIVRVSTNKLATVVKIKDLEDNLNVGRLENLSDKDYARIGKYHAALRYLRCGEAKSNVEQPLPLLTD